MSMLWFILLVLISIWKLTRQENNDLPEVQQIIVHHDTSNHGTRTCYSADQLRSIGKAYLSSKHRRPPDFKALRVIKDLKINARRIRLCKWKKLLLRSCNLNNLATFPRDAESPTLTTKNILMATVNVRSVRTSMNQLLEVLHRENLDIVVVTETWLKNNAECNSWLDAQGLHDLGYKHDNIPRKGKKRGGGLLLIYKSSFKLTSSKDTGIPHCENRLWSLSTSKYNLFVLGIYHPPQSSKDQVPDSIFSDTLTDKLSLLLPETTNLIILGDFNIHVNDVSDDTAITFIDAMESIGLYQHVQSATHIAGNTLDLIFSEPDTLPVKSCLTGDLLSDHRLVICEINLKKTPVKKSMIKTRKIKVDKIPSFVNNLQVQKVLEATSLHEAVSSYESMVTDSLDINFPLITKQVSLRKKLPWFTSELKTFRQKVRNRERVWIKYQQSHQWTAYKAMRNQYRNKLNYHKKQFLSGAIKEMHGDTKKLYQLINNLTSNVSENPMPDCADDAKQAEDFADFFLNKILTIRSLFNNTPAASFENQTEVPLLRCFAPLTQSEVRSLIMDMKTKSCELDPLPTHLLKDKRVLHALLPAITKIVNLSLTNGEFDQSWKCAIVRPLLKKPGLDLIHKNYRPVSNLQFVSKLVERAVLHQFNEHCLKYKLIPDYQSAYREGYSCETVVLKLMNDILWAMEKQKILVCVMLDLSAAFDTVDHSLLLSVLEKRFSITDKALCWYESYLRPRSFKVSVNNVCSSEKNLTFSVPQGSASGANLFVGYCESLVNCIPNDVQLQGFADDHFTHSTFKANSRCEEDKVIETLERTFLNIKCWMSEMRLKLNSDKTEFIMFGNQVQLNKTNTDSFHADSDTIKRSDCVRVLGSLIDKNAKMSDHVNTKCKIALYNYRRIRSIRKYLTKEACESLLLGLVMSHLDYNNAILIGISDYLINKFQRVQNMCAKLVLLRTRFDSATAALKELHWLNIKNRLKYKLLCIMHKCTYGQAPGYLKDLLVRSGNSARKLRSHVEHDDVIYVVPFAKLKTFAERSFSIQGPKEWNNISKDLRLTIKHDIFKKNLKTWLFECM